MPQGLLDAPNLTDALSDADVVVDLNAVDEQRAALRDALRELHAIEVNADAIISLAVLGSTAPRHDEEVDDDAVDVDRERFATSDELRLATRSYPSHHLRGLVVGYSYLTDMDKPSLSARYSAAGSRAQLYHLPPSVGDTAHHVLALHAFETSPHVLVGLLEVIEETAFVDHVRDQLDLAGSDTRRRELELCAHAVEQFKSSPDAFAALYPEIAEFIARELHVP